MILQLNTETPVIRGNHPKPQVSARSEAKLLAAAKRGDSEAFAALCEGHTTRLYQTAFHIVRNSEDAEDALQDSLMRAFVHVKNFHGRSSFSTWLTRILINSALMIRRKNRNSRQISVDEQSEYGAEAQPVFQIADGSLNPEQRYMESERTRVLRRAVKRLRPRLRAVLEIGQLQELSMKETARVLDISVAAAKGRFFHARAQLRRSAALRTIAKARTESAA
jgi:RNA polymerase sigma factor (sigma-70 family)